jgi:hypothetical protein
MSSTELVAALDAVRQALADAEAALEGQFQAMRTAKAEPLMELTAVCAEKIDAVGLAERFALETFALLTGGAPRVDAQTTYATTIGAIAARPEDALSAGRIWIAGPDEISVLDASTRAVLGSLPLHGVSQLFAAHDGSLWGATSSGTIFSADRATADQGGTSGLRTWSVSGGTISGIAPLTSGDVALVQPDQVLLVRDGVTVASAPLARGSSATALTVDGEERIFVTSASGLTSYAARDLSAMRSSPIDGGAAAVVAVDWFDSDNKLDERMFTFSL